jgi:surface antigen
MSLSIPEVEPIISNDGRTHLVMLPRAQDAMEMPELPSLTPAVPGNVLPRIVSPEKPLQCVPYARSESGIEIRGNANRWWQLAAGKYQRSRRPEEGSVFVMKGYQTARRGHVAVVKQIVDSRTIVVDHANWGNDGRIYLQAPVRDLSPKNDWSQVQVWFTPGQQWGRRVYKAKGFILPTTAVASATGLTLAAGTN